MGGCATAEYKQTPQARPNAHHGGHGAHPQHQGRGATAVDDSDIPMTLRPMSNKPIKRTNVYA